MELLPHPLSFVQKFYYRRVWCKRNQLLPWHEWGRSPRRKSMHCSTSVYDCKLFIHLDYRYVDYGMSNVNVENMQAYRACVTDWIILLSMWKIIHKYADDSNKNQQVCKHLLTVSHSHAVYSATAVVMGNLPIKINPHVLFPMSCLPHRQPN